MAGRAYCSDACRRKAWGQDNQDCVCEGCGNKFPRRNQKKYANRFCSRGCAHEVQRKASAERKRYAAIRGIVASLQKAYRKRIKAAMANAAKAEAAARLVACINCGKLFRNGRDKLCSVECRRDSRRRNKRCGRKGRIAHGHVDRCKLKGLPYDPSVTRSFVLERDAGVCMLCGVQTVPGDRMLAPTIGHVIPLNNPLNHRHGHTKSNTFTNCARCNGRQGNAVVIDGHQNCEDPRQVYLDCVRSTGYPLQAR